MDLTTKFDQRLQHVPEPWRGALVDVIDTAEAICLGLQQPSFGVSNPAAECPELVAALTRLACERSNTAASIPTATTSEHTMSKDEEMEHLEDAKQGAEALDAHRRSGDAGIPLDEVCKTLGLSTD